MVVLPPGVAGRLKIFPVLDPCLVRMFGQTRGQGDVFQRALPVPARCRCVKKCLLLLVV